jgi:O-antigen ligase
MSNGMIVLIGGLGLLAWLSLEFTHVWIWHEMYTHPTALDGRRQPLWKRLRVPVLIGLALILVLVVTGWALSSV